LEKIFEIYSIFSLYYVKVYILKIPKIWGENMLKYAPNFSPLREKNK
jgi:hypothetical protein